MTADGPVVYSRAHQQWFVSGHDQVLAVLRSPNSSTAALADRMLALPPYTKLSDTAVENFRKWLLVTDPPMHTRLRGAVSRAFTPKRIATFEPSIREITDERIAAMADDDAPDVVPAFTASLPIDAIAAILGLPTERWDWLRESSAEVALARHPDQRTLLRTHRDIVDNAVEELVRFDTTAQFTGRNTTGPIQVGDVTIPGGSNIALMIGAANRDRRRWPDADELHLDRPDPKPISFGRGIHHCLGASLARLEMRIAIPAFLEAFGDYTVVADEVRWKRSHTLRGPTSLVVRRASTSS